jgi:hypothetical protein
MRSLGNALVWIALTVGLPGVLYAMTVAPHNEVKAADPHNPATCAVCRHYRGVKIAPALLEDSDIILVSPGHPMCPLDPVKGEESSE